MGSLRNSLALAAALAAAGCSLVTTFDLSRAVEDSDSLCSDGIDNDGNGLTDCQDWACLGKRVCCTRPVVVLSDDFAGPACAQQSCDAPAACAPDPSLWTSWGAPEPLLCAGGLSPHKSEQCYAVGVVGVAPLSLHPGLSVSAHVEGLPEISGGLELGVTLKSSVVGAPNPCASIEGALPIVALKQVGGATSYKLQALFDGAVVGTSGALDGGSHEIGFRVVADRTVAFVVDGNSFATSPETPAEPPTVHVELDGVGVAARFTDVRVTDGTQCDSPGSWAPSTPFVALAPSTVAYAWDSQSVSSPAVVAAANGDLVLYYSGCSPTLGAGGCGSALGLGRAVSVGGQPFARDLKPRVSPTAVSSLDVALVPATLSDVGAPLAGYFEEAFGTRDWTLASFNDTPGDPTIDLPHPIVNALSVTRSSGVWDDDVCCSTVVDRPDRRLLWYSGRTSGDNVWRIGLAESMDGGAHFTRVRDAPVLQEGARDTYDSRGAWMPYVLWDEPRQLYRMWYTAVGPFGVSSIAYAVSTDGIAWHKLPGNPVVKAADVGLESIGRPSLLDDQGRTRMWVQGSDPALNGTRIYTLENDGRPPE